MADNKTTPKQKVGDYEFSEADCLGQGSFSTVYKGHVIDNIEKCVAMKQYRKEKRVFDAIEDLDFLKSVNHVNIVEYIGREENPQHIYIIMEYCNGGSLASYLQSDAHGCFTEEETRLLARQLFDALEHMNEKKIIHRDIKPEKILIHHTNANRPPRVEDCCFKLTSKVVF